MFDHILVPLDGSPLSEMAWHVARDLAERMRARMYVLEVVETLRPTRYSALVGYSLGSRWDVVERTGEEMAASAHRYLDELVAGAPAADAVALVRTGDPVRLIRETASEVGADLIVMSTHGRSGLARVLLGSVAEEVLRTAPVPVLLVGPHVVEAREANASAGTGV